MPAKHTKNVVLTDHHLSFVERLVESGRYQNASEVMRDGLRALEDRIKREEAELAAIQDRIGRSLDQLDRGAFAEGSVEDVFDRAFARAKERRDV
ncbi:MAG: type II toxin-antitoxin system ParD family antitoxin [Kiloniellales bacterium]|nr:type II toxin-antitoxin system ParD family antitoxin [Kiloniellales bacterium]